MIYDLELKRYILENGIDKEIKQVEWSIYCSQEKMITGEILPCLLHFDDPCELTEILRNRFDRDTLRVAHNLNTAYYKRKKRLQNVIQNMLNKNNCVFLTLTFTDSILESTTAETRRRYVTRYLKSQFPDYVANIDFGTKNDREHYHAVIIGKVDLKSWTYGAINAKNINNSNPIALAKYITKITHHALKSSNKVQRVIYSR